MCRWWGLKMAKGVRVGLKRQIGVQYEFVRIITPNFLPLL